MRRLISSLLNQFIVNKTATALGKKPSKPTMVFSIAAGLILNVLFNSAAVAEGDAERGEVLSQTCLGCHGAPGFRNASPVYRVPMIGGQNADYIVSALQSYKNKSRSHPTMQAQAASLTDQDMQDIGVYFAGLSGKTRLLDKPGAAAGKEISATCAGCHGADGNSDNEQFPKLAGQYDDYIERALLDYQSGKRNNAIMSGFVGNLSKQDIKNLADYFRSQQGDLTAPVIKVRK